MTDAVFLQGPSGFEPSEHATGPWDRQAMHGGAPAALMARAVEALDGPPDAIVTRFTVDFAGPVPMRTLAVQTRVVRPGKRVQVVEADLRSGDDVLGRARALRIRTASVDVPATAQDEPPPPPDGGRPGRFDSARDPGGFVRAMDVRYIEGAWEPGPATVWLRLTVPLVDGEEPSPLQRVVAAADFANGVGAPLPFVGYLFINPDLDVHLHRPLEGEWVCLESRCTAGRNGVGQSDARLYDTRGPIGRTVQSLYVDTMDG